jgi:serine-type D-Ala-D-Ala carboxypeptidase (penicillin-binding protein 5/6)
MDADSGRVIWSYRGGEPRPIASTTKILTALVVSAAGDLDNMVSIDSTPPLYDGTIGLGPSDHLTRRQLLYLMLLPSANDAAYVLAKDVGGTEQAFVDSMNAYAKRLDTQNVHMTTPHGLPDPNHKATADALARWSQALLKDPVLSEIVRTKTYRAGRFKVTNTNWLLWTDPQIIGIKTGYTDAAGYCLVAAARTPWTTLISVILGEPVDMYRFRDSEKLIGWAETRYHPTPMVDMGRVYALPAVPAWNGLPAPLVAQSQMTTIALDDASFRTEVVAPTVVEPPIRKGEVLGFLRLYDSDRVVGSVPLVAQSSIRSPSWVESLRLLLLNPRGLADKARLIWDERALFAESIRGEWDRLTGHVPPGQPRGIGGVSLGSS